MQRRKFLIGVGALAAGSAAAMGTGAVTNTRAQRAFSAEVSGDATANLAIDPNTTSDLVSASDTVSIDFEGDQNSEGGLNQNAVTGVRPAFTLQNNFSTDIYVEINNPLRNEDISSQQVNNLAAATGGGNSVTVPAGLDVQFLAASEDVVDGTGDAGAKVDLIDRSAAPKSNSGPDGGNDFGEQVDPDSIKTDLDTLRAGGNRARFDDSDAGYVKIGAGNQADVIVRALVNGYDGTLGEELTSAPFIIRAFTESSEMATDDEVATY
jgi:hypothetical protein